MPTADNAATAVRQANAREVLLALRDSPAPLTVAEVAVSAGLSRPTVDAVLRGLVSAGPVRPALPAATSAPGRPARRFCFDPSAATVAAVDIGTRTVRCTLADAAGTLTVRKVAAFDPAGRQSRLDAVVDVIDSSCKELDRRRTCRDHTAAKRASRPAALGVAVPGILTAQDRIGQSLAVPDLVGVDVGAALGEQLNCPVVVENDIKLAAYAEHHLGPAVPNIAYVEIGHRISVALILEGRMLQGSHRLAGELGTQRGMRWTQSSHRGRLRWSSGDEAEPLFTRAAAGEQDAAREIEDFCAEIAPRLATLLLTVDPDLLVVGGGLSRAGAALLEPLQRHIHRLLMSAEKPALTSARLTTDGAVVGALGLAFERCSAQIFGIAAVASPWHRFDTTAQPRTTPDP